MSGSNRKLSRISAPRSEGGPGPDVDDHEGPTLTLDTRPSTATEVQLLQNENEDLRTKLEKSERQNRQLEKRAKESTKGQLRKENDDLKEKISQMENELQRFAQSQRNNIEERVVSTTLDTNLSSLASPTQVTDQEQVLPPLNCYREKIWIPDDSTWYGYLNIFKTPFKYQTKKVLVVDPYIQQSYQIENFESFCFDLVHKTKMGLRKITLMTCKANEGNTRQEQRLMSFGKDWLEKRYGIKLEIRWVDDKLLHRRHIDFCNGWEAKIDRGLDIKKKSRLCKQTDGEIFYQP